MQKGVYMNIISKEIIYEAQEKSPNGDYWFVLGSFKSVGAARSCLKKHYARWYEGFNSIDEVDSLRIVGRSVIEVVL